MTVVGTEPADAAGTPVAAPLLLLTSVFAGTVVLMESAGEEDCEDEDEEEEAEDPEFNSLALAPQPIEGVLD